MTYKGRIENGVVVLERPGALPDGTEVSVRAVRTRSGTSAAKARPKSVYERYKRFVGAVKDLPPDSSINLEHYLYGAPRRK